MDVEHPEGAILLDVCLALDPSVVDQREEYRLRYCVFPSGPERIELGNVQREEARQLGVVLAEVLLLFFYFRSPHKHSHSDC